MHSKPKEETIVKRDGKRNRKKKKKRRKEMKAVFTIKEIFTRKGGDEDE